jgi:hypothetical protein
VADDWATARAAWWAWLSLRRVKRLLPSAGVEAVVAPPPRLPACAERGVWVVLDRSPATCLERALVLQRWFLSQGRSHDVVLGVAPVGETAAAHAWLDGLDPEDHGFAEIYRLVPPPVGPSMPGARAAAAEQLAKRSIKRLPASWRLSSRGGRRSSQAGSAARSR